MPAFNFSNLDQPASQDELNASGRGVSRIAVLMTVILIIWLVTISFNVDGKGGQFAILAIAAITTGFLVLYCWSATKRTKWSVLLERFSAQNKGVHYEARKGAIGYSSAFDMGFNHEIRNAASGKLGQCRFWIGTYTYETYERGSEGNSQHFLHMAYYAMPASVPHMFFDSRRGSLQHLKRISYGQQVQLPESLRKFYKLYAPVETHEYVKKLLTDPVRQALLDLNGQYDIEVVRSQLFLMRRRPLQANSTALQTELAQLEALGKHLTDAARTANIPTNLLPKQIVRQKKAKLLAPSS